METPQPQFKMAQFPVEQDSPQELTDQSELAGATALTTVNRSPLAYWQRSGYSSAEIDQLCQEMDKKRLFMRLIIENNEVVSTTVSQKVGDTWQGHAGGVISYFKQVLANWDGPALNGRTLVWLEDGMWTYNNHWADRAPILAFCRHYSDFQTLLIPDPAFMSSEGYEEELSTNREFEAEYPWEKKYKSAFWRGAASGGQTLTNDTWKKNQRLRVALEAQRIDDISVLDAMVTKIPDWGNPLFSDRIRELGVVGERVPFTDMLRYRYQIDVDGECCAWMSFFQKLSSASVVMKLQSEYYQWYYPWLQPWVHYIPIRANASDLEQMIYWAREHDEQARQISENANRAVNQVRFLPSLRQMGTLLEELFAYQKD